MRSGQSQSKENISAFPTTLVDIKDFTKNANDYYERAKNGERIFVTIDDKIQYEVFTEIDKTTSVFSESARPELTEEDYEALLDILDPLD